VGGETTVRPDRRVTAAAALFRALDLPLAAGHTLATPLFGGTRDSPPATSAPHHPSHLYTHADPSMGPLLMHATLQTSWNTLENPLAYYI
jgi:hypothetical protein